MWNDFPKKVVSENQLDDADALKKVHKTGMVNDGNHCLDANNTIQDQAKER